MHNVRNVLVAIDLGESSTQVLGEAKELAARYEARLHLLCVVQDPSALPWAPAASTATLMTLVADMQRDARAHLDQLMPPEERERLHTDMIVTVGRRPARDVLAYAADKNIDVIVVGKSDHGGSVAAVETGSVAEAVVRGSSCPVLVIPAPTTARRGQ
jgi:universal stress protein A